MSTDLTLCFLILNRGLRLFLLFTTGIRGFAEFPLFTTGIRGFTECRLLCRVSFITHSAKKSLPRAALGKVWLSVKSLFTECRTLGTERHSAKRQRWRSAKGWRPSVFAESRGLALGKESSLPSAKYWALGKITLCRVSYLDTRQSIFLFFRSCLPNFLWYVPTLCRPTCIICGQL
jgi:hypothetical protein